MLISRSIPISEICRAITTSQKSFAAKYQKFWGRLSEVDLARAKEQLQNHALREIQDGTKVADGSDDHKIKSGYWLLVAVAVNPKFEDKTPRPLELSIYSSASESFISENALINEFIADVFQKGRGKGLFTIDSGGA